MAKLTFFSRFGWDVMEPICYFMTFYTGVGGLLFFQYNKIEYTYPALFAFLVDSKRMKLYKKKKFDIESYTKVQGHVNRLTKELKAISINEECLDSHDGRMVNECGYHLHQVTADKCESIVSTAVGADAIPSGDLWSQHSHAQTGKVFYYNMVTGETRWERPDTWHM